MKGKISEVFESIQGEGIYLGEQQLFVRFFGCNLNCNFCDTRLNYYREYEPAELFEELKAYEGIYHSVVFTGGEPLLQKDFLKELSLRTGLQGYKNYLETNGTLTSALEEVIEHMDIIAMDLKLPSSTQDKALWDEHREFLKIASQKEVFLKSVICESTKEEELRAVLELIKEVNKSTILVLQPNSLENHGKLREKLKAFKDICARENVIACVIPQMHKIIGIR